MNYIRTFAIGVAASLLLVGVGGAGSVVAQPTNDNPDHPACQGDKWKISSEGSEPGSQYWTKAVCSDGQGPPERFDHNPDDVLSVPESENEGEHDNGRERSDNFDDA